MLDFVAFLTAVGPVAIFITKAVDAVRSFDHGDTWPKGLWIALALVFGVVVALLTGVNFVGLVEGVRPEVAERLTGTVGEVLTGLAIGGTASFWHEQMDKTSSLADAASA
jgi:hypothetical protein